MDIHELALKTYADLQKRKEKREQKNNAEANSYRYGAVCKANKQKYRHYYSRGTTY